MGCVLCRFEVGGARDVVGVDMYMYMYIYICVVCFMCV